MKTQLRADLKPLTLEEAGRLLRQWQLNEWALEKKMTKRALREQRWIVWRLLTYLTRREVISGDELDHIMGSMN